MIRVSVIGSLAWIPGIQGGLLDVVCGSGETPAGEIGEEATSAMDSHRALMDPGSVLGPEGAPGNQPVPASQRQCRAGWGPGWGDVPGTWGDLVGRDESCWEEGAYMTSPEGCITRGKGRILSSPPQP